MFAVLVGEAWKGNSVFKTNLERSILSLFTLFHFYFESHLLAQRNKFSESVNVQGKTCTNVQGKTLPGLAKRETDLHFNQPSKRLSI